MAAMNTNIPMMGQGVNALQAIQQGTAAAEMTNQNRRNNALEQFMQTNGGAVMSGDEQALGQYAALAGPEAALGVQNTRLGMDATRQGMARTNQVMRYADTAEGRAIEQHAASLSAADREALAAKITQSMVSAATFYSQGNLAGVNQVFAENQLPPVESLDQAAAVLAQADEARKVIAGYKEITGGANDMFRIATPEEAAQYGAQAGQFGGDGRFYPVKGGMELTVGPDGSVRFLENGTGSDNPNAPSSPESMIASIDGILKDPALDTATGALSLLQALPGTPMYRFGQRTKQLEGQAFLQAFESLKGAGQITEIEGTKATQAIGRLSTWQSPEDYRNALGELRSILVLGSQRPQGWASSQGEGETGGGEILGMTLDQLMRFDVSNATSEQMDDWERRFKEVNQ